MIQKLSEIITEDYKEGILGSGTNITLKETSKSSKCPELKIIKRGRALIFRFDRSDGSETFPFYKNVKNLKKITDYIIIYESLSYKNAVFIFLCELKSDNIGSACSQIKSSFLFVEYLVKSALRISPNYSKTIEYRGLAFCNAPAIKGSTNGSRISYKVFKEFYNLKYLYLRHGGPYNLDALCV